MNKQWVAAATITVAAVCMAADVSAYPEYVAPTAASGCTACHNDNYGNGFKAGILAAFEEGGLAGLKAFLHPVVPVNHNPVLRGINSKWDITVGETPLVIPFKVYDADNDSFALHGSAPTGYSFSTVYIDSASKLPTMNFKWSPTAAQANKLYVLSVYAKETGSGRTLSSNTVKTTIQVWPARTSVTKNISQFMLLSAQWKDGKLNLAGWLAFKPNLTTAQRAAVLANLTMSVKSSKGYTLRAPVKLTPQASGNWYKSLALTDVEKVSCAIKLEFEGLKVARTVTMASEEDECED
ncbi:MAG: hypothetical protein Q7U57_11610 [Methylovulum sp.]|nr:hypothetical protein [Methylovulum sp.]